MKQILLTQNKAALVDDSDYEWLNQWKWNAIKKNNNFYARRISYSNGKQTSIYMHRQILNILDSSLLTDHIDGNGLNNQKNNLRTATKAQNNYNRKLHFNNTWSNYIGVSWNKRAKKWVAYIKKDNKLIHLGYYSEEKDAATTYNKHAIELRGDFAKLNKL